MSEQLALLGGPRTVTMQEELHASTRSMFIGKDEQAAVIQAMNRPDLYSPTAEVEKDFADYHGVSYALGQCNGTSTLQAAFFAVGVKPGDEVICPAYTWHLAVSAILTLHAIPVFCDIDPQGLWMCPEDLRSKITPRTKAISVLHTYGAVAPMDAIMEVARDHGLPVIEDASHAHGAVYKGRKVGTIGDIGCFSLQASKLLSAVEGGVMITDNRDYYERAVLLVHYERISTLETDTYKKYIPPHPGAYASFGYKYRMHPWAAAMARVQLGSLDARNAVRDRGAQYLNAGIRKLGDVLVPPPDSPGVQRTWLNHICQYFEEKMDGISRDRFVEALYAEGLPAGAGRAGYLPVYWNPLYRERNMWDEGCPFDCCHSQAKVDYAEPHCPEAEKLWKRTVGLPVFCNACDDALLDQCIEAIAKVMRNRQQLK